jgi:hypothetical protein
MSWLERWMLKRHPARWLSLGGFQRLLHILRVLHASGPAKAGHISRALDSSANTGRNGGMPGYSIWEDFDLGGRVNHPD